MKCKKCGHEWEYKGASKIYLTCPHCYRKIKVIKNKHKKVEQKSNLLKGGIKNE